MMDKRGEGVRIILERSTTLSGRQPEYRLIDDAELLLTIYAAGVPSRNEYNGRFVSTALPLQPNPFDDK
jgi:hypothetical protein